MDSDTKAEQKLAKDLPTIFEITRSPSDLSVRARLIQPDLDINELSSWLDILVEKRSPVLVDLSQINIDSEWMRKNPHQRSGCVKAIIRCIARLVISKDLDHVFLPSKIMRTVKKGMRGMILKEIGDQVPNLIHLFDKQLDLKDLLNLDQFEQKIQHYHNFADYHAMRQSLDQTALLIQSPAAAQATPCGKGLRRGLTRNFIRRHKATLLKVQSQKRRKRTDYMRRHCYICGGNVLPPSLFTERDTINHSSCNDGNTNPELDPDEKAALAAYSGTLCLSCAKFNYNKRFQTTNLTGKYAVVTGARIKIGYDTALRLLRDGCYVVATTRFSVDAAERYAKEKDFDSFSNRLHIYGLDLRDIQGIRNFIQFLNNTIPHLDILINNAAQTIHRPAAFYNHLLQKEICLDDSYAGCSISPVPTRTARQDSDDPDSTNHARLIQLSHSTAQQPASKTQAVTIPSHDEDKFFPTGALDIDQQQVDLRPINSWRLTLPEVPVQELLEVFTINTIGPFLLCQQLKPLMAKSPSDRKFIVNVSAMEGQFSRAHKTMYHPHTNMAKAALNMLTRTTGLEYRSDKIYMTAVDTGWVTDERPYHMAQYEQQHGFRVPLSNADGSARVYDPIVTGLKRQKSEPQYAVFLKNYEPHPW